MKTIYNKILLDNVLLSENQFKVNFNQLDKNYNFHELKTYINNDNVLNLDKLLHDYNLLNIENLNKRFLILKFNKYNEMLKDQFSIKLNDFLIIDILNLDKKDYYKFNNSLFKNFSYIMYENIYNFNIETNF